MKFGVRQTKAKACKTLRYKTRYPGRHQGGVFFRAHPYRDGIMKSERRITCRFFHLNVTQMNSTMIDPRRVYVDLKSPYRPALDLEIVERSLDLVAEKIETHQYHVQGGEEHHYVTLTPYFECHCGDFVFRERICKHLVAALIEMGDAEAVHKAAISARRRARKAEEERGSN